MNDKIKIVKKDEAQQLKAQKRTKKLKRPAAPDMVTTVTGWVADLKQRKSKEAQTAFDLLFSVAPRPSES